MARLLVVLSLLALTACGANANATCNVCPPDVNAGLDNAACTALGAKYKCKKVSFTEVSDSQCGSSTPMHFACALSECDAVASCQ